MNAADAIVVLGCRVRTSGEPSAALARRVRLAQRAYAAGFAPRIIASGGRLWGGVAEADCIAQALAQAGVPLAAVVRERCSLTTVDNAYYCAEWLTMRGYRKVMLCTCAWHQPRAARHFAHFGITVRPLPPHWYEVAPQPCWRPLRERLTSLCDDVLLAVAPPATPSGSQS